MTAQLDHILALIDARLAALRAAASEDYRAHRADYERRANDYALAIRTNGERLVRR
jgi:hypothetical protein